ncbi:Crp/Fnr family transcriptional regulator [Anaerolinea thermophila]|nr:Crp/Fnr family transcriptional regulator [Anaerolinea thermophila]
MNEKDLTFIYKKAFSIKAEAGSFLFFQGDPAENLFFLVKGHIRLFSLTPEGQQVLMHVVTPGNFFAIVALVPSSAYPVSAEVTQESILLKWNRDAIEEILKIVPAISLQAMRLMAERLQEYQQRFKEIATQRVERRLARMLIRLAAQSGVKTSEGIVINLPLTRQDLAEMVGTTLYTVSRFLSQWESRGIIFSSREKIIIKNSHLLMCIAEDLPEHGS